MIDAFINLAYLLAAVLFIYGLKMLSSPRTAVRGNLLGALGMLIAIVVTLVNGQILSYTMIVVGLLVGSALGAILALRIHMTAMPQMVALLNGFGGAASTLVAGAALLEELESGRAPTGQFLVAGVLSGIIGAVTFWGSMVAYAKLQELLPGRPLLWPGRKALNAVLLLGSLGFGAWLVTHPAETGA